MVTSRYKEMRAGYREDEQKARAHFADGWISVPYIEVVSDLEYWDLYSHKPRDFVGFLAYAETMRDLGAFQKFSAALREIDLVQVEENLRVVRAWFEQTCVEDAEASKGAGQ